MIFRVSTNLPGSEKNILTQFESHNSITVKSAYKGYPVMRTLLLSAIILESLESIYTAKSVLMGHMSFAANFSATPSKEV